MFHVKHAKRDLLHLTGVKLTPSIGTSPGAPDRENNFKKYEEVFRALAMVARGSHVERTALEDHCCLGWRSCWKQLYPYSGGSVVRLSCAS